MHFFGRFNRLWVQKQRNVFCQFLAVFCRVLPFFFLAILHTSAKLISSKSSTIGISHNTTSFGFRPVAKKLRFPKSVVDTKQHFYFFNNFKNKHNTSLYFPHKTKHLPSKETPEFNHSASGCCCLFPFLHLSPFLTVKTTRYHSIQNLHRFLHTTNTRKIIINRIQSKLSRRRIYFYF